MGSRSRRRLPGGLLLAACLGLAALLGCQEVLEDTEDAMVANAQANDEGRVQDWGEGETAVRNLTREVYGRLQGATPPMPQEQPIEDLYRRYEDSLATTWQLPDGENPLPTIPEPGELSNLRAPAPGQ